MQRRTHTGKILRVEDVEYRPQRGLGTATLVKAWFAVVVAAIVLSLGLQQPAAVYLAAFPAPDPEFTDKAGVIKDRWRAAAGRASVG